MRIALSIVLSAALGGCATIREPSTSQAPVEVQIIAINDFHGALEPPQLSVSATDSAGAMARVPAGGAAYLASAIAELRQGKASSVTVAAGDLTSASPFVSSQFLDEPSIVAMNMIGLEVNAVGNHEFDRGVAELKRLQGGGCAKHTALEPCRVERDFPGARFRYLAANVKTAGGDTLFPETYLRRFGSGARSVAVGFIGLTLRETPSLVDPSAVSELRFEDEADTINALVPKLRAEGADAIVVLIHQGMYTESGYDAPVCSGISGDLLPILDRLDPAVDVVVSGHTHRSYVCDMPRAAGGSPLLVTSAGRSGMLVTDIGLSIDPITNRVAARRASNVIVQSAAYVGPDQVEIEVVPSFRAYAPEPMVAALVARYVAAAGPIARRPVGTMTGGAARSRNLSGESVLGDIVADSQLRAAGAEIAFMNSYGLRADLTPGPDGVVTFGQLYAVQPFGNIIQVKELTGAQVRAVLELQFASATNTADNPYMLQVSQGFAFAYDLARPAGQRIVSMTLDGRPIEDARRYRVAVNNFLATGGDNFTVLKDGRDLPGGGMADLEALESYLAANPGLVPPATGRIRRIDVPAKAPPSEE